MPTVKVTVDDADDPGAGYTEVVTDTGSVSYHHGIDGGSNAYTIKRKGRRTRGRPVTKDWAAAAEHVAAQIAVNGGLPERRATVEGWCADWFDDRSLDASESLIRDHVANIYAEAARLSKGR